MYTVEIVYGLLNKQTTKHIKVTSQTSVLQCIVQSGILEHYPEIDLTINKVGIYSQVRKLGDIVKAGDRIEIYRPLIADPKDVRRKRAVKQKRSGIIK